MLKLVLQRASDRPLYHQLADQLRELIRCGALPVGARLPTVRQMAQEYGLTRLTVHSAYMELQSEGLIEGSVGRGTFVADRLLIPTGLSAGTAIRVPPPPVWLSQGVMEDMMRMHGDKDLIAFAAVAPAPETYPTAEFNKSLRASLDKADQMGYGSTQGEEALREQVAHLLLDRGVVASPANIMITAGAQQGIDLVLRALATPDDIVLVEECTYVGMIEMAVQRSQRLVSIPSDAEGIRLDLLEAACQRYQPHLLYLVPTFHNPTGYSLSPARRQGLLDLAKRYDFLILEDDIYGFLAYDGPAPLALKADDHEQRVIYMLSFSKVLMPGLRLCALVLPPDSVYMHKILALKRCSDLVSSPFLQHALAHYLQRNRLQAHIQRVRPLYKERRDTMLTALDDYLPECSWTEPAGGMSVWVTLPAKVQERSFYLAALEHGVGVAPGSAFFALPPSQPHMRLSFSMQPPAKIRAGISILGRLLEN